MPDRIEIYRNRPPSDAPVDPLPPALRSAAIVHDGRYCRLEPVDARVHAEELFAASHGDDEAARLWQYMSVEPFPSLAAFASWLRAASAAAGQVTFAIRDKRSGRAGGMASYLNIDPVQSTIEIGSIWFGPALQNTAVSTEALYLLMRHALDDLGYRRLEWKCDALNRASRRAALRLGFIFEGIFYQHRIVKGHNRDTAWFSILDSEWPALRSAFDAWLDPANFDDDGRQRAPLAVRPAAEERPPQ